MIPAQYRNYHTFVPLPRVPIAPESAEHFGPDIHVELDIATIDINAIYCDNKLHL
jgi:hypothetical protein